MSRRSSIRGSARPAGNGRAAFSMLEILVVLAIFGLISALLIGNGGSLLQASSREDTENSALSAIAAARHQAVLAGRMVELRLDEKARVLDWGAGRKNIGGGDGIKLLPAERTGAMLLGGRLEENAIPLVRFYPDGTCDAFRLEITHEKNRQVMAIDPWTCTVLADNPKKRTR